MDRDRNIMKKLWNGEWSREIYRIQPYRLNTRHHRQWFEVMHSHFPHHPLRVLEFGAGAGHRWHALQEQFDIADYIAIDYSQAQLDQFKELCPGALSAMKEHKLHLLKFDLDELPLRQLKNNEYDLIFTAGALMHLYPDTAAKLLTEMLHLSNGALLMHLEENNEQAADIINGYNLYKFYESIKKENILYFNNNFIHQATDHYHPKNNLSDDQAYSSQLIIFNTKDLILPDSAKLEWLDYHGQYGKRTLSQAITL